MRSSDYRESYRKGADRTSRKNKLSTITKMRICQYDKDLKEKFKKIKPLDVVENEAIRDIYVESVYDPYLIAILTELKMIRPFQLRMSKNSITAYWVSPIKYKCFDMDKIIKCVDKFEHNADKGDRNLCVATIMSIIHFLNRGGLYEVDGIILEGNSPTKVLEVEGMTQ